MPILHSSSVNYPAARFLLLKIPVWYQKMDVSEVQQGRIKIKGIVNLKIQVFHLHNTDTKIKEHVATELIFRFVILIILQNEVT